eukprot:COSAG01_NODE_2597_length_7400_cov_37.453363_3_plen_397_part_00
MLLLLLLLLLLPAVTAAAAVSAVAPPHIASVSPSMLPTIGATVLVRGSGFGGAAPGYEASCRLASATPGSALTHEGYAGKTDLRFPATVVNDSLLSCAVPSMLAPGPALLSVAVGCIATPCKLGNWQQHAAWAPGIPWARPARVTYFVLADATVGRRPYINETSAELLIRTHQSLWGRRLVVRADLPLAQQHVWQWSIQPQNGSDIVHFSLLELPSSINADIRISVTGVGLNFTRWRRLQRAPPLSAGSSAVPVVVDHTTKSLTVGGEQFIGLGFYLGLDDWNGTAHVKITPDAYLGLLSTQAPLGVNQCLLAENHLEKWTEQELLYFMDGCHKLGVKVLHNIASFGTSSSGPNAVNYSRHWDGSAEAAVWNAHVIGNVSLLIDHPALLGFYICDE